MQTSQNTKKTIEEQQLEVLQNISRKLDLLIFIVGGSAVIIVFSTMRFDLW